MKIIETLIEHVLELFGGIARPWTSWDNFKNAALAGIYSFVKTFTDLQSALSWPYMLSCLLLLYAIHLFSREKSRTTFVNWAFPLAVYLHPSATLDYKFGLFNACIRFLVFSPIITGVSLLTSSITSRIISKTGLDGVIYDGILNDYPVAMVITIALQLGLFIDLLGYIAHVLLHHIPILWAFHKVHHSAKAMTPFTLLRAHPLEELVFSVLYSFGAGVGAALYSNASHIDLPASTLFGVNAVIFIVNLAGYGLRHSHVWISYGPVVGRILMSPAAHQIHHSKDVRHINKNFGLVFSFWDALFGSLILPRRPERLKFGIVDGSEHKYSTILRLYLYPFVESIHSVRGVGAKLENLSKIISKRTVVNGGTQGPFQR